MQTAAFRSSEVLGYLLHLQGETLWRCWRHLGMPVTWAASRLALMMEFLKERPRQLLRDHGASELVIDLKTDLT